MGLCLSYPQSQKWIVTGATLMHAISRDEPGWKIALGTNSVGLSKIDTEKERRISLELNSVTDRVRKPYGWLHRMPLSIWHYRAPKLPPNSSEFIKLSPNIEICDGALITALDISPTVAVSVFVGLPKLNHKSVNTLALHSTVIGRMCCVIFIGVPKLD